MTKTFSTKSNAKRAALAAGLKDFDLVQVGDRWAFQEKPAPKAKPTKVAKPRKEPVAVREDGLRVGSAGAKMVDLVLREGGATMAELLAATGWKQCRPMLVKACERAGVKLTLVREGKVPGRYVGTRIK